MSLTNTYTYEEGSNGSSLSVGVGGVAALSAATYATAAATHGALGVELGASGSVGYTAPANGQMSGYWPGWSQGTGNAVLLTVRNSSTQLGRLRFNATSGKYEITNQSNAVVATSTVSGSATQAGRADVRWVYDGTGNTLTMTVRLFLGSNVDGTTPTETMSPAAFACTLAPNRVYLGTGPTSGWTLRFDSFRIYDDTATWPVAYVVPVASLSYAMSGAYSDTTIKVHAKIINGGSVRMAYSTNSSLTSPLYTSASAPDSDGYVKFTVSSLTANTKYYYQLRNTPSGGTESTIGSIKSTRTRPSATGTATIKMAVGSCVDTETTLATDALVDIVTWDPTLFVHLGDAYYDGLAATTSVAQHLGKWEKQVGAIANWSSCLGGVPFEYTNSDHELNPDNTDSNTSNATLWNTFFRDTIPHTTLAATDPTVSKHRSWVASKIRFIMIDTESTDRSPGLNTDNSSKTMLGATQLAWLLNELDQSELLKVVLSAAPWSHSADVSSTSSDKWWAYANERQIIANHITSNGINVDFLHGDSHRLGVDATHNAWGGFPVLSCAPLAQTSGGSETNGYWDDYWPLSGSGQPFTSGYMRATYEWLDADSIRRTASGWDAVGGVQRVSLVTEWNAVTAPVTKVYVRSSAGTAVPVPKYYKNSSGAAVLVSSNTAKP